MNDDSINEASPLLKNETKSTSDPLSSFSDIIDVLVIGAGPTGLTAAAEALRYNFKTRIIERNAARITNQSRALVLHARALELLHVIRDNEDGNKQNSGNDGNGNKKRASSIATALLDAGTPAASVKIYTGRDKVVVNETRSFLWGDTNFPYYLMLPQYDIEDVIQKEVERLGGIVEWNTTFKSLRQDGDMVEVTVTSPDGKEEKIKSRYVIGCDGGRSPTRDAINICMERQKSDMSVIVADFKTKSAAFSREGFQVYLRRMGLMGVIPLVTCPRKFRIFAKAPEGEDLDKTMLNEKYIDDLIGSRTGVKDISCYDLTWATYFKISFGVADAYRSRRVFLAGDACHVHSPAGGQGMNYGIHDAINLIWKLAWAKRCKEGTDVNVIFDSYQLERQTNARGMIRATRFATYFMLSTNWFLSKIRELFIPFFITTRYAKSALAQAVPMLNLRCHDSSPIIFKGRNSGSFVSFICRPGDRLPNLNTLGGSRLYENLSRWRHSWVAVCTKENLVTLDRDRRYDGPGGLQLIYAVVEDNVKQHFLLVRPDLYVAGVCESMEELWDTVGQSLGEAVRDGM